MSRALLLAGAIYALILVGLLTRRAEVLALAIPLVAYLSRAIVFGPSVPKVEAARSLSANQMQEGHPVDVSVRVTWLAGSADLVLLEDNLPESLEVEWLSPRLIARIPQNGSIDLAYRIRAGRGHHLLGPLRLTVADEFGLNVRSSEITLFGELLVTPEFPALRGIRIRPRTTRVYSGVVPAGHGGPGVDFFGVGLYHPGDPLRWINWRASARYPEYLYVNEFDQERVADIGVVLDARQRSNQLAGGPSLLSYSIQAAAAIASAFLRDGNRVGLLIYGGHLDWTFPGYGKVQQQRILTALARCRPGQSEYFDSLDQIPTRLFPSRSQIVFISPLLKEDSAPIIGLRARGYHVLVITPDPVAYEADLAGPTPEIALAARIAAAERILLLRALRNAGVRCLDWNVEKPLVEAIEPSISRPDSWFRALGVYR